MKIYYSFADGQPHTRTDGSPPGWILDLQKFFEDFVLIFWFDTDAVVTDIDSKVLIIVRDSDTNFTILGMAEFHGVGNQIDHYLNKSVSVTGNIGQIFFYH